MQGFLDKKLNSVNIYAFSVFLLVLCCFLPSVTNDFVTWDDTYYISQNPNLTSLNAGYVKWAFTTHYRAHWSPLLWLGFGLEYSLWGADPTGYHAVNILFHAVNAFLVTLIVARLFRVKEVEQRRVIFMFSALAGLFFALHPLRVEAVSWASSRKDVQYGFFYLMSIYCYLRYTADGRRSSWFYAASLFTFLLSLLSKPMAVSLPFVLLLLDYYPLERFQSRHGIGRALLDKLPFIAIGIFFAIVTVATYTKTRGVDSLALSGSAQSFAAEFGYRLGGALDAIEFYVRKTALPFNLSPYYPDFFIFPNKVMHGTFEFLSASTLVPLGAFFVFTGTAIVLHRKYPVMLIAWMYFLMTIFPTLGFIKFGITSIADRFAYLPSLGLLLLVLSIGLLSWLKGGRLQKMLLLAGLSLLLAVFSVQTVIQQTVWRDPVSLWRHASHIFSSDYYAARKLGQALMESGRYPEALTHLSRAISLNPFLTENYPFRSELFIRMGQTESALRDLSTAVRMEETMIQSTGKSNMRTLSNLIMARGRLSLNIGRPRDAIRDFQRAMSLGLRNEEIQQLMEQAYRDAGGPDSSRREGQTTN